MLMLNLPEDTLIDLDAKQVIARLKLTDQTLQLPDRATIIPEDLRRSYADAEQVARALPKLQIATSDESAAPDLQLRGTLGQGGMGRVLLAEQLALGREVAVKSLRPELRESSALRAILQEAWISGRLEHPNIVPIYALGRDDQDSPLIVMKRVEGVCWTDYIHGKVKPSGVSGETPLTWHLDILKQVCRAIHYAHSRGIIHRDLKPDNVMIGAFGEVYVLDWGIAVSLQADRDGRLPLARDARQLAGTPAYMAPEMTIPEDATASIQTDLYLLGAILHELLTGAPPHQAGNLTATLRRAYVSEPQTYADEVHPELVQIAHTAMAREPKDRYADAEALRQAIITHLTHLDAIALTRQGQLSLARLEALVLRDQPDPLAVHPLFGACRFAFEQSLRRWEGNEEAARGLHQCLCAMLSFELDQRNLLAAQALIASFDAPDALRLRALELARAQRQAEREVARLKALRHQVDTRLGAGTRAKLALVLAALWGAINLATYALDVAQISAYTSQSHLWGIVRALAIALIIVGLGRRLLFQNKANRLIIFGLMLAISLLMLLRIVFWIGQTPLHVASAAELCVDAFFIVCFTITGSYRIALGAICFLLSAIASLSQWAHPALCLAAGCFFGMLPMAVFWHLDALKQKQRDATKLE